MSEYVNDRIWDIVDDGRWLGIWLRHGYRLWFRVRARVWVRVGDRIWSCARRRIYRDVVSSIWNILRGLL